ncbi:hypothetical protein BDP27DRAFT_1428735 [Rhodocollybia butyracea]|uniref:Uncharacterized protein n=1 Tax=Rhodocollybia butyracea TaxID=206335 RepID=A0A9P5PE26_9AGAR|nr:hypothetical protein BDP27DRAFT_1428735 [Rhodocollybia butyracea]
MSFLVARILVFAVSTSGSLYVQFSLVCGLTANVLLVPFAVDNWSTAFYHRCKV